MYKKASQLKLRIATTFGSLSVEQLWDLTIPKLDAIAVRLEEAYKESGAKSFVVKKTKKDAELKLAFDVVLDILTTKVENAAIASKSADTKAHNQKILSLIADAEDEELKGKSKEELLGMLK